MRLHTPKRYRSGGRRIHLISMRWLFLYLLAPVIIIPAVIAYDNRETLSGEVGKFFNRVLPSNQVQPTPSPTIPVSDLRQRYEGYIKAGDMNNAISALTSLSESSPNDASIYTLLTEMTLFRGDPDDTRRYANALKLANNALDANPEAPDGWIMMAMVLNNAPEPDARKALRYILRARDLDDKNPMMLAVMAETYMNLENTARAEELVDQAITLGKAAPKVDVPALAYAYVISGNLTQRRSGVEAIKAYEEAWRIAQTDVRLPLGFIASWIQVYYSNTNDRDKIIDVLTKASQRDKNDPIIPYLTAMTWQKFGDVPKAQRFFEQCLDLDPNNAKCLRRLGVIMLNNNNAQRAADLGQRIIDNGTTDPRAYLLAGYAYALTNRCVQAVPLLQKGMQLNSTQTSPDPSVTSQLQQALQLCGASAAVPIVPTATPSVSS